MERHQVDNHDPIMTWLWPNYDPIMTWSGISRPPLDSCQGGRVQHLEISRVIIIYYHHESDTEPFLYSSFMIINSIISFDFFMDKHNHDRESEPFLYFSLSGSRQRSRHETCRSKWCNHEYDRHDKHDTSLLSSWINIMIIMINMMTITTTTSVFVSGGSIYMS